MASAQVTLSRRAFGETSRRDAWWAAPLGVFLALSSFIVYATWAAFEGVHYHWGPYLSPFYAPELFGDSPHAWFGAKPAAWPAWLPFTPALLILPFPGAFRVTCYYYRGAYYKAFWADPPSCTVGEGRTHYRGEHSFPLILQNVHRYFLYVSLLFLIVLAYDVWAAMWFPDPVTGARSFGVGVGTLVLAANVVLLGGYTSGCHSMRHIVGGRADCLTSSPARLKAYECVSCLNRRHMVWAWLSLFSVAFADFYVRMVSMGVWADFRII